MKVDDIMSYASTGTLKLCGSMLVLAISLKVIGIDFEPIFRAYSLSIERGLDGECDIEIYSHDDDIEARLEVVETLAHPKSE